MFLRCETVADEASCSTDMLADAVSAMLLSYTALMLARDCSGPIPVSAYQLSEKPVSAPIVNARGGISRRYTLLSPRSHQQKVQLNKKGELKL